jgi:hypothetical protein
MQFSKTFRGLTTTVALAALTAASAPPFSIAAAREVADGQPTAAACAALGFKPAADSERMVGGQRPTPNAIPARRVQPDQAGRREPGLDLLDRRRHRQLFQCPPVPQ